jgi:protein-L-isoaspartate(D-aspartate) O-methyltransferase
MTVQTPIPDFRAARAAMIDSQLRPQGVSDHAVVRAMSTVERERFVPADVRALAYIDRGVPLGGGRFLSPPTMLGQLLTELAPKPGQRALIVGAGTGYSAALLAEIGLEVVALESDPALIGMARALGVSVVEGPLTEGWGKGAPYDLVLIDGAVEFIPDAVVGQLAEGGRLGAALVSGPVARLIIGRKSGGAFGYYSIGDSGAPALPGFDRPQSFIF